MATSTDRDKNPLIITLEIRPIKTKAACRRSETPQESRAASTYHRRMDERGSELTWGVNVRNRRFALSSSSSRFGLADLTLLTEDFRERSMGTVSSGTRLSGPVKNDERTV